MQIIIDEIDVTEACTQCTISRSTNAMCWEVRLTIKDQTYKPYYNYGQQRITITDDFGDVYGFLLEEWSQKYDPQGEEYDLWGRSLQARAGKGYAKTVTDTENTESSHVWQNTATSALSVVNYLISSNYCPYPLVVDWQIPDYPIKKGALSVRNQYPLDIILMLASEAGAYVFPMPDGSLIVEEYGIVSNISDVSYNDIDDISDIPGSIKAGDYYNSVTVLGYDESVAEKTEPSVTAQLSVKSLGSGTNCEGTPHTVRVYYYHPSNASLQIFSTQNAAVVSIGGVTESFTETLILKNGLGSHSLFDSNGKNDIDIENLHNTKAAYYEVSYSAPYIDYHVDGDAGNHIVFFYYSDGSAEAEYSFSTEFCPPPPTCGQAHPELCTSQSACQAAGLYWWDNACHTDSQPTKDVSIIVVNAINNTVLPGATVYVDGIARGTTDSEGKTGVINLTYGTHTSKINQTIINGVTYAATDADKLENDTFNIG